MRPRRRRDRSPLQLRLGGATPVACSDTAPCQACRRDQAFLRGVKTPKDPRTADSLRIVDLFAGAGAMSIGFREAARRAGKRTQFVLAVDSDPEILCLYDRNLSPSRALDADATTLFDGSLGDEPTSTELELSTSLGAVDVILGGPPCQGHSDLNNHSRQCDPKNALYLIMARATEVIRPSVLIVENVAAVQRDRSRVVETATDSLRAAGYVVAERVLDLRKVGVPQRRRRHVLLASNLIDLDPATLLNQVATSMDGHPYRTVSWAVRDLLSTDSDTVFDTPSRRSDENRRRMAYLFEKGTYDLPNEQRPECHRSGDHKYLSVYGRLKWNEPAQTITTGFGSMGQGRYVHPQRRRTITPHEAARLQTFPDWFNFGETTRRVLAKAIGNAVPPILLVSLGARVIAALDGGVR